MFRWATSIASCVENSAPPYVANASNQGIRPMLDPVHDDLARNAIANLAKTYGVDPQ